MDLGHLTTDQEIGVRILLGAFTIFKFMMVVNEYMGTADILSKATTAVTGGRRRPSDLLNPEHYHKLFLTGVSPNGMARGSGPRYRGSIPCTPAKFSFTFSGASHTINYMSTLKLIIAGSRGFGNLDRLEKEVLKYLKIHKKKGDVVEVLSGTARGADKLGEVFAQKYGLKVQPYPAEWDVYGKKAGMIRNQKMADNATHCILFWDGHSPGTRQMARMDQKSNLKLKICVI